MTRQPAAAAEYEVVRVLPPGGDTYAYRLPVPRGWSYAGSVGRALDLDTIARPLGTFVPPDRSSSIVVAVTPLPIEVRLEEWLGADLGTAGWQVDEMDWHRVAGAAKLAIVARRDRHVRAVAAMADGGRLYAVYVQGPATRTAEVAKRLWWSAMAFDPCRRGGPDRLEARMGVELDTHAFDAPISWHRPPAGSVNGSRVELVLRHPAGDERARMIVRVDRATPVAAPLEARREATLGKLRRRGLVLARSLESPTVPWRGLPADWELRSTQARTATGQTVEILLVHGNSGAAAVEILAVGSREAKRSWMRTTRAVEIASETLAPRAVATGARR